MPFLSEYSDLADSAIDGLQDFLAQMDEVVDRTILTTSWAESEIRRIEARDSSILASINKLIIKIVGFLAGVLYTQTGSPRSPFRTDWKGRNTGLQSAFGSSERA